MNKDVLALQSNPNFVILNNPLANPKFIRAVSKGEKKALSSKETYTPKLFFEIASKLTQSDLEKIREDNGRINENASISVDINIKQFAEAIGATKNNNFYADLKNTATYLANIQIPFVDANGKLSFVGIVNNKTKFDEKGSMTLFVDGEMAEIILDVKDKENFSFLKEYYYGLQNGQALKLYPFFKSWVNKGKYETDLERFKKDFGFDTSGYDRFNKLEKYVLNPAIEEINERSDIIVKYVTTGENLESKRPRIKGLIFYIKAKEKLKQLATGERHEPPKPQEEPSHISNLIPKVAPKQPKQNPKPQATAGTPSEAEIQQLGEKLKLNPEQVQTIKDKLRNDYIRVFEVLQGCINEVKAGNPIKSNIAYILGSIDSLGIGLFTKEQAKAQKREAERIENEKRTILNQLQKEYNERRNKQFTELYNKAAPEQIEPYYKRFQAETNNFGMNFFIDLKTNKFKETGIYTIGEELAEIKGLGKEYRQAKFRQEVFEKHNLQVGFDTKEEISIISLFEQEQPQEVPQPIEATPTAPSMATTPQPHTQEQAEPKQSENFTQNKTKDFEKQQPQSIEQIDNVETPKSIKSLLGKWFR